MRNESQGGSRSGIRRCLEDKEVALLAKVEGENSIKVTCWGGCGRRFSSCNVRMRGGVGTPRVDVWYPETLSPPSREPREEEIFNVWRP